MALNFDPLIKKGCHGRTFHPLDPWKFPQLQQLAIGNSATKCTKDVACVFQEEAYSPSESDLTFLCARLGAFRNLRSFITTGPEWEVPPISIPSAGSILIGDCTPGYKGYSGVRCAFSFSHLVFGPLMCKSLTHLRLRLHHSVGWRPSDPCDLDLTPLHSCARLEQLVIAVERRLTQAWSISGFEALPARAHCRVDICPVSMAPEIRLQESGGMRRGQAIIVRHEGAPC